MIGTIRVIEISGKQSHVVTHAGGGVIYVASVVHQQTTGGKNDAQQRNSMDESGGLVGLLALTSACGGNKDKPAPADAPDTENPVDRNGNPLPSTQTVKQPAFKCSELSLEHCEKSLFGEKRCKKEGKQCVEDTSSKPPETCSELSDDDCTKSLACTAEGDNGCREDTTYLVAPCKDKDLKDCSGMCRADTVLPICLENKEAKDRSGRCVFKAELCAANATCANVYSDGTRDLCEPNTNPNK